MAVTGTNSLNFATGLDNTGLLTGSASAVNIISRMASTIARINPFAAIAVTAAAAFGVVANQAYKLAREFEQAMKEVETISAATQENFKGMSSAVFALSKISPDGPVKLAKAFYQIVSAGYDGAAGLKLLETATKAATAGVTTTQVAADGITTVLNAFKLEAKEADEVADAMFQTVKLGKTTFEELSSTLSTAAPLAAATGFSYQELLAAVASLTKQGVPTAQAMTQVRAALESVGEVLGDGAAKSMTFQNAMQSIYDIAGGSQVKLKELTGRMEAMSAVLGLAGPKAAGAAKDLDAVNKSAGEAGKAFSTMTGSNINEWSILSNKIKTTTEDIGKSVVEISSGVAKFLNTTIDGTNTLQKSFEDQRTELYRLEGALRSTNEGTAEFERLRKLILDNYPEFIGEIDAEKASTEDLLTVLNDVNEAYKQRYKLEQRKKTIKEAVDAEVVIENNLDENKAKFRATLAELQRVVDDKGSGVKLKINFNEDDDTILKSVKAQLAKVNGALDTRVNTGEKYEKSIKGFASGYLTTLNQTVLQQNKLTTSLTEQTGVVSGLIDLDKTRTLNELRSAKGRSEGIRAINAAMKESDLTPFRGSGLEEVDNAIKAREVIVEKFARIDEAKDLPSLKPYLDSELTEIQAYAKARERELTFTDKANPKGGDPDKQTLESQLKEIEARYKAYFSLVRAGYLDLANENYAALLTQGDDFNDYLDRRIAAAKSAKEKEFLILAKAPKQVETVLSEELLGLYKGQSPSGIKRGPTAAEQLSKTKPGIPEALKIETNPSREEKTANEKLIGAMYNVADGLYGVADLYTSITGDEETGQRIKQVAGVAEGVGMIASGNIVGGAMKALTSAISVEIESETAKFQDAIDELNKSIAKLDYAISRSFGSDKVSSRKEAIDQLTELQTQANLATQAEKEAEKHVKLLGITIGKKGKGSGTDQAKLDEIAQAAEDARRKVDELKDQLNQLYTGTTASGIADSITQGFRDGKKAAIDFAEDFKSLMQNALLQAFQINYLEDQIKIFYDLFAEAGSDGSYTAAEIESLRGFYTTMIDGAQDDLDAINAILEGSGIGALGSQAADNRTGLSGAITAITEDTANLLAGYMNAVRLDIKTGLEIAVTNSNYLSQIALNTSYNHYLESIDRRFTTIESAILQFQARG